MIVPVAAMVLFAFQATPEAGELVRVARTGDPLYVVSGSVVHQDHLILATLIKPLGEYGLMSMRVQMDCAGRRYRTTMVSFYNQDGSLRRSADMSAGGRLEGGWATRNADGIAEQVCS